MKRCTIIRSRPERPCVWAGPVRCRRRNVSRPRFIDSSPPSKNSIAVTMPQRWQPQRALNLSRPRRCTLCSAVSRRRCSFRWFWRGGFQVFSCNRFRNSPRRYSPSAMATSTRKCRSVRGTNSGNSRARLTTCPPNSALTVMRRWPTSYARSARWRRRSPRRRIRCLFWRTTARTRCAIPRLIASCNHRIFPRAFHRSSPSRSRR